MADASLHGRHLLVVEDEYLIADDMRRWLTGAGARVVGPAASSAGALALLASQPVDGAVLDVKIADGEVFAVAVALEARGIPFIFATGYNSADIPSEWSHVPRYEKPVRPGAVVGAFARAS